MVTAYDVDGRKLIAQAAIDLKEHKALEPPEWSKFVKTGVCAERLPEQENWWFIRGAAMLRKIYLKGPMGVRELRKAFGKKRNMGSKPSQVYPASGSVTRKLLQQLQKAGYLMKLEKNKRTLGRAITPKGQKFLDSISRKISE